MCTCGCAYVWTRVNVRVGIYAYVHRLFPFMAQLLIVSWALSRLCVGAWPQGPFWVPF